MRPRTAVQQQRVLMEVEVLTNSFLLLVAMPFAPSSVLAPSSKARSPSSVLVPYSDAPCY